MHGITSENVHYWNDRNPWHPKRMSMDIPKHGYAVAKDIDTAINRLYELGFKESARELNNAKNNKAILHNS